MIKVAVAGAAGRMGQRLLDCIGGEPRTEVAAVFEAPGNPTVGKPVSLANGLIMGDDPAVAMAAVGYIGGFHRAKGRPWPI